MVRDVSSESRSPGLQVDPDWIATHRVKPSDVVGGQWHPLSGPTGSCTSHSFLSSHVSVIDPLGGSERQVVQ